MEEAHRAKAAALRDDDNVFDVAYEQQGSEGQDVLSATDIKVSLQHKRHLLPAVRVEQSSDTDRPEACCNRCMSVASLLCLHAAIAQPFHTARTSTNMVAYVQARHR